MPHSMKIVIPMAGFGTRMRPHTWSKPKPLIHLAGRTVLDYVLEQFTTLPDVKNAEWVFILGPGQLEQVQAYLAKNHPEKKCHFVIQAVMRGQSDAMRLAAEYLHGPLLMTFSDTLIETDLGFLKDITSDGIAWVKPVEDPRRFGAAKVDADGWVTKFVEKPQDMKDNLVVVGFYYFKSGEALVAAIEDQIKRNVQLKGEFYLTDAINIMLEGGARFRTQEVKTWLDAGTRESLLETNRYLLDHGHGSDPKAAEHTGVAIVPPVFIPPDVNLENCVLGPHVSLGAGVTLKNVIARDTIIEDGSRVSNLVLEHTHLGKDVQAESHPHRLNLGDTSFFEG